MLKLKYNKVKEIITSVKVRRTRKKETNLNLQNLKIKKKNYNNFGTNSPNI